MTWAKNGNLGRFTNFVNLMDMAAVAVPSGIMRCKPAPAGSTGRPPLHAPSTSQFINAMLRGAMEVRSGRLRPHTATPDANTKTGGDPKLGGAGASAPHLRDMKACPQTNMPKRLIRR